MQGIRSAISALTVLTSIIGSSQACGATLGESRSRCLNNEIEGNDAVSACTYAIRKKPKDANLFIQRGVAWSKMGDHEFAIGDFSKALRLNSKAFTAYYLRGLAREAKGQLSESLVDFKKYAELRPNDPESQKSVERIAAALASREFAIHRASAETIIPVAEHSSEPVSPQPEQPMTAADAKTENPAPKDDFFIFVPILLLLGSAAVVAVASRKSRGPVWEQPVDEGPIIVEIPVNSEIVAAEASVEQEQNPPLAWVWSEYKGESS